MASFAELAAEPAPSLDALALALASEFRTVDEAAAMARLDELGAELGRALVQLDARADACDHPINLLRAGHLQPVRSEVVEAPGVQEPVELRDHAVQGNHFSDRRYSSVWTRAAPLGCGAPIGGMGT